MTEKYDFVTEDGRQPPNLTSTCWNRILLFHTAQGIAICEPGERKGWMGARMEIRCNIGDLDSVRSDFGDAIKPRSFGPITEACQIPFSTAHPTPCEISSSTVVG